MNRVAVLLAASLVVAHSPSASRGARIRWLDVASVPNNSAVTIPDGRLGDVSLTTNVAADATYTGSVTASPVVGYDIDDPRYLNWFDSILASVGTLTLSFDDGPITAEGTHLFVSTDGLFGLPRPSSFTFNGSPTQLGQLNDGGDGPATITPLANGFLQVQGAIGGFNHTPDLYLLTDAAVETLTIQLNILAGDGVGLAIGVGFLEGDYNGDGVVDAADFTVWRDQDGVTGLDPWAPGDGDGDGDVDTDDYFVWRSQYGVTLADPATASSLSVPEPAASYLTLAALSYGLIRRRR